MSNLKQEFEKFNPLDNIYIKEIIEEEFKNYSCRNDS